jgi:hypothetical protein
MLSFFFFIHHFPILMTSTLKYVDIFIICFVLCKFGVKLKVCYQCARVAMTVIIHLPRETVAETLCTTPTGLPNFSGFNAHSPCFKMCEAHDHTAFPKKA